MANYYSGRDVQIVHCSQGTFGTLALQGAAGYQFSVAEPSIDHDMNLRESDIVTGQRWKIACDVRGDDEETAPKITESGVVFRQNLARQFYSLFQNVTEVSGSGGYKKTFTFHDTQPDFTSDAGFFETFVINNPIADKDQMFKDVITQEIALSMEPRGELSFSTNYVARGQGTVDSTYSGSLSRECTSTYKYSKLARKTVNIDDAGAESVNLLGPVNITLSQTVKPVGVASGATGDFETYMLGGGGKTVVVSMQINFDSLALDLKDAFTNDKTVDLDLAWGGATAGDTLGDLSFTAPMKVKSWSQTMGEDYLVDIEFECVADDSNDELIEVIFTDSTELTA